MTIAGSEHREGMAEDSGLASWSETRLLGSGQDNTLHTGHQKGDVSRKGSTWSKDMRSDTGLEVPGKERRRVGERGLSKKMSERPPGPSGDRRKDFVADFSGWAKTRQGTASAGVWHDPIHSCDASLIRHAEA